ncbi:keratin, type II cytoskeletal 8-like [Salvelinus fontinalis]|uniref:keratin, type II cytoskeletal 8-like n=1 Tax=Salvelinus fontinalis TaxID=8038 RepID=UPI00248595C4|nr:keratin, type II cytoskeletal 8-like [Salvelinus fontinalis]
MSIRTKNRTGTSPNYMRDFSSMSLGSRNGPRTSSSGLYMGGSITAVTINKSLLAPINLDIDPKIQAVRTHEINQIKGLNNRFATFIDKVRHLEQQNKMLETKWKLMQDQTTGPSDMGHMFQTYIKNLQRQLDQINNDKDRLDMENRNMHHNVEDFKSKYEDEISKRNTTENDFVLLKKDVDAGYLSKVDLEDRLAGLGDEVNFLKVLYDQELGELQSDVKDTSVVVQMDNSRGLDMNQIIADVKAQYEDIAARSREQAESWYKTKVESLAGQAGQAAEELRNTKAEIAELNRLISRLQNEILAVKGQKANLESQITEAEEHGEIVVKDARTLIKDLEVAMQRAKQDMACQIREYQDLMNVKLALDIEISTYRKLLEGEETKFGQQSITNISTTKPCYTMPETSCQQPTRSSAVFIKMVETTNSSRSYH